jgi:dienelactone hydrolase
MYPFAAHYAKLGLVGISMSYRLHSAKTGVSVFDCVKDARAAVRYIRAHATELGIDPQKIIVSGGSAGGHLAVSTALFDKVNEEGDDLAVSASPNALVLLFPVIDTSKDGYGQAKIGERWQELSPAHNVRAGLPPTLIFHGTGDTVTPFAGAKTFHEAMLKAGNRCELDINEGGAHGYLMRDKALFDDTMKKTDVFLKSLGLPAAPPGRSAPSSAGTASPDSRSQRGQKSPPAAAPSAAGSVFPAPRPSGPVPGSGVLPRGAPAAHPPPGETSPRAASGVVERPTTPAAPSAQGKGLWQTTRWWKARRRWQS